jgi:YVTN family beta-propeller protein
VGLALDETAGRLFVACRDANTVVVVDVNTQQQVGRINVAPTPGGDWPGNLPTD